MFRIRNGPANKSTIEDIAVPFGEQSDRGAALIPAAGAQFRRTAGDRTTDWHSAPRRRLIVWLAGEQELIAGDGSRRTFSPGDLFLADDTQGEGHVVRMHDGAQRVWVNMPDWTPLAGRSPLPAPPPVQKPRGPQLARVYTGGDDRSHFQDITWEELEQATPGQTSWMPVRGVQFRRWAPETVLDFHTAPRRQILITLSGMAEVEVGSGEKRQFLPGDMLLAEDTAGQGHISRYYHDRRAIIIVLGEGTLARSG